MIPTEMSVKYNESELSATFPNGSAIELKGADNEDSLRGIGLDFLVVDEFASIYDNWSVYHEVLRPALADKKGKVLFIGTPRGKDSFYELWLKGQRHDEGWKSWQFKTIDNPYIDKKEVEEAKASTPDRYFRQEYEASFEGFVGLIYPELCKNHIIPKFDIPAEWEKVGAIDPAMSGRTAALFGATDTKGTLYIYNEYYELDVRVSEVVSSLNKIDKIDRWLIDPASKIKSRTQQGQLYSLWDEYSDRGIHAVTGENDVNAGINRVAEYLKTHKLYIFNNCRNLIWELERYHWAESKESIKGEVKAQPFKKNDHLCDALRYMIMARPKKGSIAPKKIPKNSVAYIEQQREIEAQDWRSAWN